MATFIEVLRGINAYPIPLRTLSEVAERRKISLTTDAHADDLLGKSCRLAKADLLLWLSFAPDISQGGQSYSFTDEQRKDFKRQAQEIYDELEPLQTPVTATFGYKGSRL